MTDGISYYSKPGPDGKGVVIDLETMLADIIIVCKAGGFSQSSLVDEINRLWPAVTVQVSIPEDAKQ